MRPAWLSFRPSSSSLVCPKGEKYFGVFLKEIEAAYDIEAYVCIDTYINNIWIGIQQLMSTFD